ncbi:MAG: ABC transporter ATP-binding protein [Candidatus Chaera renei]|uniref:ABC transporter ATP-binding protein n=1 Tax=Candidatus Chaera renei TaxID=2506947 RepID=A0A4Q0AJ63_9BACT|nr:MAG: ABC transporter ATP-binding protein [Candidatus Chaera renei]
MNAAISLNGLSKVYAGAAEPALRGVSLAIAPGEIYGFLGPNGAGKSTCIRTLMGFIRPTAGKASILGLDIVKDSVAIKRRVGYLAGEVALYQDMTGRQLMDYLSALQPLKSANCLRRLVEDFQAEMNRPVRELSKGNRQKLGIIQAFAHQPEVLILDEPTGGLDPLMQEVFYDLVATASGDGASVFFSSHNLSEVQRVCRRIGFIKNGRLVAEHPVNRQEAGAKTARQRFIVSFDGPAPYFQIKNLPGVKVSRQNSGDLTIEVVGELAPLLKLLGQCRVKRLTSREQDIESEFLNLYQEES